MEKLWAPWRINYISKKKQKKCIFCAAAKVKNEENTVFRSKYSVCILNIYPYNNGHLMVSPRRHTKDLGQLMDDEILDLIKSVNTAKSLLEECLKPQGFNIGINLSSVAGAGITGHLHIHIVPRWKGDTNFMPVIYGTKVISQSLRELRKKLKKCLKS